MERTTRIFDWLGNETLVSKYAYTKNSSGIFSISDFISRQRTTFEKGISYNNSQISYKYYLKTTYETLDDASAVIAKYVEISDSSGVNFKLTWSNPATSTPQYTDWVTYWNYRVVFNTGGNSTIDTQYTYDISQRNDEIILSGASTGKSNFTGMGFVDYHVTERNRQAGLAANPSNEYFYATEIKYDELGRQIGIKNPVDHTDDDIYYAESKVWYTPNTVTEKTKINQIGQSERWAVSLTVFNWQGLPSIVCQRGTLEDSSGTDIIAGAVPDSYVQYLYDIRGKKVREYSGLHAPLEIDWHFDNTGQVVVDDVNGDDLDFSVTAYEYDIHGNLVKYTDALGASDEYAFDESGRITYKRLRNGKAFQYEYNFRKQLEYERAGTASGVFENGTYTGVFTAAQNGTVQYGYDDLGNMNYMLDWNGEWTWVYDAAGLLLKETMLGGYEAEHYYNGGRRYFYKLSKNMSTIKMQGFQYNSRGEIIRQYDGTNPTPYSASNMIEYEYDADGNLTQRKTSDWVTSGGGPQPIIIQRLLYKQDFSYNNMGFVKTAVSQNGQNQILQNDCYQYDLSGRMVSQFISYQNREYKYKYDPLGRLVEESTYTPPNAMQNQTVYEYDDYGNRTLLREINAYFSVTKEENYTYDKNNRLISQSGVNNGTYNYTYTYDLIGNLTGCSGTYMNGIMNKNAAYTYDLFNRMTTSYDNSITAAAYIYDGLGRRFSKSTVGGAVVWRHIWDGDTIIWDSQGYYNGNVMYGEETINYWHGPGGVEGERVNNGALTFYLRSPRGDIIGRYNTSTGTGNNQSYGAFGNKGNGYGYTGEYSDAENGFVYLRARYYDPATSRFTQEDPASQGNNYYSYCGGDPVNRKDPSGLWWVESKNYKDSGLWKIRMEPGDTFEQLGRDLCGDPKKFQYYAQYIEESFGTENAKNYKKTITRNDVWVCISPETAINAKDALKDGYINAQNDDTIIEMKSGIFRLMKDIPLMFGNMSLNGCGIIAAYNVLHSYSSKVSFGSVYNDFNNPLALNLGIGLLGVNPEYLKTYLGLHFWLTTSNGPITWLWGIQTELAGAVIALYAHTDQSGVYKLSMHYVARISTGNGGARGSFKFYNTGLRNKKDKSIDGVQMSIWDFLDVLEYNKKTPIMLIGVAGKKGWW